MKRFRMIWPRDTDFGSGTERNSFANDPRPDFIDAERYVVEYSTDGERLRSFRFYIGDEEIMFLTYRPFSIRTEEIPIARD